MESSIFINRCAHVAGLSEQVNWTRIFLSQYPTFRWEFTSEDKSKIEGLDIEEDSDKAQSVLNEISRFLGKEFTYDLKEGGLRVEESDEYISIMDYFGAFVSAYEGKVFISEGYSKYLNDDLNLIHFIGKPYLEGKDGEPTGIAIHDGKSKIQIAYTKEFDRYSAPSTVNISHSSSPKIFKSIIENVNAVFNEGLTVSKSSGVKCNNPNKNHYSMFILDDMVSVFYDLHLEDK